MNPLLKSYKFSRNNKSVNNRIVLASMTNLQSYSDGFLSENEINWLYERAKGGFGILITAATNVSKDGQAWDGEFGVYDDKFIDGLKQLTKTIHKTNSKIYAQLFHGGLRCPETITGSTPISPSVVDCKESFNGKSNSASKVDIRRIINDFANSAVRCYKAGFDGIELHGAHGYLISQFFGKKTNQRNDQYGGNVKNRSRFLVEIIQEIKNIVPEDFVIGVRLSPEIEAINLEFDETLEIIKILNKKSIDFIHLSCWDIYKKISFKSKKMTYTEIVKNKFENLPALISTGNIWSSRDAINCIKQGADFIGVARVAIRHPYWAKNITDTDYNPKRPPYTQNELKQSKLSDKFINYMRKWDKFVKQ
ncbi:MAG: NADH:flavin oxidoreductase [Candidatus Neomarinimicrobiota bacterium]|nr:NADH:flavin oxidoreductase [Candidatus Neomarinimicrobiota bacterium]